MHTLIIICVQEVDICIRLVMKKFGLFVTELRKEKNLTQKDLAEKVYVSDKTVSKWERGVSPTKGY